MQTYAKDVADRAKSSGPVMRVSPAAGAKAGTTRMSFDYAAFAGGAGDLGDRLTLVALPECALTTPDAAACAPKPLAAVNDGNARTLSADVNVAATGTLVAMRASEGGAKGTYGATPLAPSSSWSVAPSSGSFAWSYPLRLPPVPGGFGPGVSFAYNSQAVDGQTADTNNQGSWIGQGFTYEPGYVERRYKPCQDDGHKDVGDLCWAYDNLTLSLNGSSSELVRSGSSWKLANDDGSKIQRLAGAVNGDANDGNLTGEHWKLTTSDGTQYFFGLNQLPGWSTGKEETNSTWTVPVFGDDASNKDDGDVAEPCYKSTFANAWCQQAWRWNLDYALDRNNNVIAYYYGKETNSYALGRKTDVNGTTYDRGGYLKRIDYGQRAGAVFTTAPAARVVFKEEERCDPTVNATACANNNLTDATKAAWPDVPYDRICAAGTKCKTDQVSPSFFTRKRLSTVTTQIRNGTSTFADVDRYTLGQLYPDNGDGSNGLWLHTIKQEGLYGGGTALASPVVRLDVKQLENRIVQPGDLMGKFGRPRLGTVYNDTGGQLDIEYSKPECTGTTLPAEGKSTKRCYSVRWHGGGSEEPYLDWFNKYVVVAVRETDTTRIDPEAQPTPDMVTFYDYQGAAGWRYPDPDGMTEDKYKTWSEWRGYKTVVVSKGDDQTVRTRSRHTYMQGLDGNKNVEGGTHDVSISDSTGATYTDQKDFVGFEIETEVLDGTNDKVISKSATTPARYETASQTRSFGTAKATIVRPSIVRSFTGLQSGGWRETKTVTAYDQANGRVTAVDELGDVSTADDDRCTRSYYADNTGANILTMVYRTETVLVNCSASPNRATQVLSDSRTYYDGSTTLGSAPTRGLITKTERLTSHNGTTGTYQKVSESTFDAYARPLTVTDAKGVVSKLGYTETNGLTTKRTETSPKISINKATPVEFTASTELNPAWGLPTVETDWNDKRTQIKYDKLGRVTEMWTPDRDGTSLPATRYSYVQAAGKPTVVVTEKPDSDATKTQYEYQIFDGFLRPRQVQAPAPGGRRLVTDTWYTSTGKVDRVSEPYAADGAPAPVLLPTEDVDTDLQTGYVYDGADRVTDVIAFSAGHEQYRTTTSYGGDRTMVTPPTGGTATTSITDARGQTTAIWYHKGATPTGAHDTTTYKYTPAGLLSEVTNQAGTKWGYTYDQLGRKKTAVDPDAGTTTFTYDEVDRVTRTVNQRGKTFDTEYDDLGRVTGTFEVTTAGRTQLTETQWDRKFKGQQYAQIKFVNGQQYVVATTNQDALYRPTEVKYSIPADAGDALKGVYTFTTSYNTDGTVQGQTFPEGKGGLPAEAVVYRYDDLKRLKGVTGTTGSYVTDVLYTDDGRVTQAELGTGGRRSWVTFGYEDTTQRLQKLILKRESYTTPQNPTPDRPSSDINQEYTYDDAGNILSIKDDPASSTVNDTQCFTYDYMRRLTSAIATGGTDCQNPVMGGIAPYHTTYTYDAAGNRKTEVNEGGTDRTYTYPAGTAANPHAVQNIVEKDQTGNTKLYEYKYDETGNTTKRIKAGENQTLEWDSEGHLASVTNADGKKTSFVYGADGSRVLRREPTATTLYLPGMEIRLTTATNKVDDTRFIGLAAGATAVKTIQGIQFQIADPNGTGQAAVDAASGNITMRRSTPFGTDRGTPPAAGSWTGEKGFVGGTKDSTTGLTHLGAREYDPVAGRFISVDPVIDVSNPAQLNAYAYGWQNPISNPDPSGLMPCRNCEDGARGGSGQPVSQPPPTVEEDEEVVQAKEEQKRVKEELVHVAKALGKILMDELGITDALDCFTKGDIGGCINTAINVAFSIIGGAAGKLFARYAFRWKRAANVIESLWDLGGRLKGLVGDFFASAEKLKNARSRARSLADKVDDLGSSCTHSFAPATLVLLADGSTRRIDQVRVGDEVVATDPEEGENSTHKVVATFTNNDTDLTSLTIADGSGAISTLDTTQHHPFWSVTRQDWVDAASLAPGESLATDDGRTVHVLEVRNFTGRRTMHDLTVDDIHTYYVFAGDSPVLVHNNDPGIINLGVSGSSCAVGTKGDYYNMSTAGRTPDEAAAMEEYASRSNAWLEANGPQVVQPTAGKLRTKANAAARAERRRARRAGVAYTGQAGHVPDTAVTGMANPPAGWLDMPGKSNSVAGGGLSSRIGTTIRGMLIDGIYVP
ncbi:polymorphic toxin-type HINT domain-containing protein [Actinoplanes sp. NPDC049596]|uniref:polymorphic toxin-type HINT domain-containing protein n=1 Tax=Actinoplanes sp. NPDC049596 TaxID=3154625 RepID=UPI003449510A